jgi:hypothetical protein
MPRVSLLSVTTLVLGLIPCIQAARGQAPPPDLNIPETIELTVSPAPEPRPALRFQLLPAVHERTPGNAAPHYYRAIVLQKNLPKEYWQEYGENSNRWLEGPPASFPKAEVANWLARQRSVLAELKAGAHCEYCDWDLRVQDLRGMDTINLLLPEIQECRTLARTLQLEIRLATMEGRTGDALHALGLGYQLAHDTAQPPLVITGLVGIAISSMMNQELLVLIQHTDSNFYWALAALPRPLVDLQRALQYERNIPYQIYPFLKDAETAERSTQEWSRLAAEALKSLEALEGGQSKFTGWQGDLLVAAVVAKFYPVAKQELIASGMDRDQVEAMPVGQVIAIQTSRATERAYHELFKLSLLPHDEATRRLPQAMERLKQELLMPPHLMSGKAGIPIANILLPSIENVMHVQVRTARNFAVLEVIEAIRMQAAEDGKLPASLADVTVVPAAKNPTTGEPFSYRLDPASGVATLDVPPAGGLTPKADGKRYVLRLKK